MGVDFVVDMMIVSFRVSLFEEMATEQALFVGCVNRAIERCVIHLHLIFVLFCFLCLNSDSRVSLTRNAAASKEWWVTFFFFKNNIFAYF